MKKEWCLEVFVLVFCVLFFPQTVSAYGADSDNVICKKPKFRAFNPPNKSEVLPGSEISFHVTHVIAPASLEVTAKKIPVKVTIEDRNVFYVVRGKLPESLKNTYARISIKAKAELGCKNGDGWLVKITDTPASQQSSVNDDLADGDEQKKKVLNEEPVEQTVD